MSNRELEKQCDRLWSKAIEKLYEGRCSVCGDTEGCSPHHLVKRRHKRTRHAILNGIWLCQQHHQWAEEKQKSFDQWLRHKQFKNWTFKETNGNPEIFKALEYKEYLQMVKVNLEWFVKEWK